jgi:hypothetical protein
MDNDTGGVTPEQFAQAFTPRDAAGDHTVLGDTPVTPEENLDNITWNQEEVAADAAEMAGVHITLEEAPLATPDGSVGVQVPVNVIMDQIHQHWARQMADQIQRNAELSAALTVCSEELDEVRAKFAALTEVTNAPAEDAPSKVREIRDAVEENHREDYA